MSEERGIQRSTQSATLVDLLDRILDKGLVVAGDVVVQLADVELLTIKIRLIICSVDKAQEIGMDWWQQDSFLSSAAPKNIKTQEPSYAKATAGRHKNKKFKRAESSIPVKKVSEVMRTQKHERSESAKKNAIAKTRKKRKR
jgi:hypothetical protein